MVSDVNHGSPSWFVLNYFGIAFQGKARKLVERFNSSYGCSLELFAPTYVIREERDGQVRMKKANLTFHYMFIRGPLDDVKSLCRQDNGFSLLIDRGSSQRYATVSDHAMVNFKTIARAYSNCLPYFPLDDIDLEAGDLVEIVRGDFPGLVGVYMPKAGSNSGNIILHVYNKVGTMAFDVKATDVRVLEFSRRSTRANDQIDAFVPYLLRALRSYHGNEELPVSLAARLSVFCSRMEMVRINNRKLDAKLQALLFAGNHILGNTEASDSAKERYDRLKDAITNVWTLGLVDLLTSVINGDMELLNDSRSRIDAHTASSRAQRMIAGEYDYYKT